MDPLFFLDELYPINANSATQNRHEKIPPSEGFVHICVTLVAGADI